MKIVKTAAIVSLMVMLGAANANAWGKKEQGILIGVGATLLLPPLLQIGKNSYDRLYNQPYYVQQPIRPVQHAKPPQTTYIVQPQKYDFPHHRPKDHSYINRNGYAGETIIIEHADGSRTIVQK
ncbi:MAG: hypothetical protein LBT96_05045 [Campylobacteraceae bacterium]|jgi:hypothetical protein|nr:hypothetical protein [Campylobacteraceae bacterium]